MPVCTRKNCTEPPVDGYRICQKHLDIVLAGRAKNHAPAPEPAPEQHECDDCAKEPYCNGTGCIVPDDEPDEIDVPEEFVTLRDLARDGITLNLVPDYRMELIETLAELAQWQLEPNDNPEAMATLARIQAVARA